MAKASANQYPYVTFAESSAPSTPSTGLAYIYVKTDGVLYLKDDAGTETDLTASGATFSGASVYESANVTGLNGNQTITWDSEFFDTNSYHDTGSNTSRLTVPSTGYYRVSTVFYLYAQDTSTSYSLAFQINATGTEYYIGGWDSPITNQIIFAGSRIFNMTANDYVELKMTTTDTSWNMGGAANTSVFEIQSLGT